MTRLASLRPYLAESRLKLVGLGVAGLASGFVEAAVLVVVLQTALSLTESSDGVDLAVGGIELTLSVGQALGAAAVGAVLLVAVTAATAWATASISAEVVTRLRRNAMHDYLMADWPTVAEERSGELQETLSSEVVRVGQASMFFAQGTVSFLNFSALVCAALLVQAVTSMVVIAASAVLFFVLQPLSRYARGQAKQGIAANHRYAASVAETVKLTQEYFTFGVADQVARTTDRLVDGAIGPYRRGRFLTRLLPGVYQGAAILLVTGGLAVMVASDVQDLAAVGTVVVLLLRATSYSQGAQGAYHSLVELLPSVEHLTDRETILGGGRRVDGKVELDRIDELRLDHVGFAYLPDRPVLREVDVCLVKGEALGIIGASGAGKSTLLQILLRMRRPTSGRYLVNGVPIDELTWASWSRRVAVVPQAPQLLQGTVADNIRFFRDDISDDDVRRAAALAQIHDEIEAFPDGYDTNVGPRADNVSGGQRQRICIARALAGRPDVLVLDEPTSALDLQSESRFRDALRNLAGELTLVLVTHRHSTLELCDRVLVLHDGEVEALRPLAELDQHSAFFQESLRVAGAS